jgi:hypothetical protein
MPVTLTDDHAAKSADAHQAAYFRAELEAVRRVLIAECRNRRALINRPNDEGGSDPSLMSAEAEVRHLDRLIARLDSRFGADWDVSADR